MSLQELSEKLYPAFIEAFAASKSCRLFLSASTMKERAIVRHAVRSTPEQAWEAAITALEKFFVDKEQPSILRADWVTSSVKLTWAQYLDKLKTKSRVGFRQGIALDKDYKLAFMEQELNANSMLYAPKAKAIHCEFQPKQADAYCRQRFERSFPKMKSKDKVEVFNTEAIFIQDGMDEPLKLTVEGGAKARTLNKDEPETFISLAQAAANYLAAQCKEDGSFVYGRYPCNDTLIEGYDFHHHLGALFAMAQVYAVSVNAIDKATLSRAIERGLQYVISNIVYRKIPDGQDAAYLSGGKVSTAGMSGLALLALTEWTTSTGTRKYIPLMKAIARGLFTMQKADGSFIHALNIKDFSLSKESVAPCETCAAIFGMMRLYAIIKAPELLESCERILNHFIETEHWKSCDHWLAYAVNEFTLYRPEEKFFVLGLNNTLAHLPKTLEALTISPIRLEQLLATSKMIGRLTPSLMERVDEKILSSMIKFSAQQLLEAYFFPEVAMYFQNPAAFLNSFFVRDDSLRVRIDDVQHGISGLLAYGAYLKGTDKELNAFSFDEPAEELL